ncbi:MAG: guanylate kinase [Caulobacteraceae bacterium]
MTGPRRGLLLILSSPSGAGKTTLAARLKAAFPELSVSISATTRAARPAEAQGREYHFVSDAEFERMVAEGAFLERAYVHGHRYGTPAAPVAEALEEGRDVLFDIDWQGAAAIAAKMGKDAVRVFVLPPAMADLEKRLRGRAQDAAEAIARRLAEARAEIGKWADYDYVLLNDDLERASAELAQIYRAERLRRTRNPWIARLVERLIGEGGD